MRRIVLPAAAAAVVTVAVTVNAGTTAFHRTVSTLSQQFAEWSGGHPPGTARPGAHGAGMSPRARWDRARPTRARRPGAATPRQDPAAVRRAREQRAARQRAAARIDRIAPSATTPSPSATALPDTQAVTKDAPAPAWTLPVESYRLTGRFGETGRHWSDYHHGLDFAAAAGTPVRAVGRGRVISAGWDGDAYGNRIKVRHDDGTVTVYAHLSAIARTSGPVEAGTIIGYVGETGRATGPHLHLEVRPDGGGLSSAVDPYTWLRDRGLSP